MQRLDFRAILRALHEARVDFIVVGGVAGVLQGAPVSTFDLDVVHSTDMSNVERLLVVLDSLEAYYRAQPERHLRPDRSHLASPGHQLLVTRFGPLDLLGSIGASRRYADLIGDTVEFDAAPGLPVRVLKLETLIAIKEQTSDDKDRAVLPILQRTLDERRRRA